MCAFYVCFLCDVVPHAVDVVRYSVLVYMCLFVKFVCFDGFLADVCVCLLFVCVLLLIVVCCLCCLLFVCC